MALNKNILFVFTLIFILTSLNFVLAENPKVSVGTNLTITFAPDNSSSITEAIIKYDSGSKDIIVTDLNSNNIKLFNEKCADNACLRKVRTYIVQGMNNHSLVLTLNYLKLNSEVSASIASLKYNNYNITKEVKFKSGSNLIKIKFPWTNRAFSENLKIEKTNLNINYNIKKDYTKVQINSPGKINITNPSGIVLADLKTNKGILEYSLYQ